MKPITLKAVAIVVTAALGAMWGLSQRSKISKRAMSRERQHKGFAKAKARGQQLGRVAILKPIQVKELLARVAAGEDKLQIAEALGISRASVYNYMNRSKSG
jgi:DNA invertase Pin-like site-specific DNA recombinase